MMDALMMTHRMRRRDFIACTAALALPGALRARTPARVLVVGDSMSAEYGLPRGTGWVALLERRLAEQKLPATVVNASISGDTTAGGRARLPALLKQHQPTHVVIELGGNDALRGLPIAQTEANLAHMVRLSREAGARVLLVGMQVPPNYGRAYTERFAAMFRQVAQQHEAALVPFLLQGVADGPQAATLFQGDRIHPNEQAQPIMLDNVWPVLRQLLAG
jgi:acyl-CoA thioesterase-1